jgi:diguanylate cyclase (GGDEF)-like protein
MWRSTTLKSLTLPGGILLLTVAVLVHTGWLTLALPALSFLYYCAIVGGMLLAWRFHSSRIFLALFVLFFALQAVAWVGGAHVSPVSPGWTAFAATMVLVPLNFVLISLMHEHGFMVAGMAPLGVLLFLQTVVVAVLSQSSAGRFRRVAHAHHAAANPSLPGFALPGFALTAFALAIAVLLLRSLITHKPQDAALMWSLVSFFLAMHFLGVARASTAYSAAAACILATSIIETSYLLAYHDELTALPSRRAFNDAMARLQAPYSIAAVDIDHFKKFNDTYGHDTGDQVLRLVAGKLARVTGGGQAFRCGGEEFVILFPGKTAAEVSDHLEQLRATIEAAEFRQRGNERRQLPRGTDRRGGQRSNQTRTRGRKADAIRRLAQTPIPATLSVTVSIGVASNSQDKAAPELVLEAADKALYRAKANGRNRLEKAPSPRRRVERSKSAGIA